MLVTRKAGILLEAVDGKLNLAATDMEGFSLRTSLEAQVETDGAVVVPAPQLRGFPTIGAPRFELGTSCPPDKRANQAAPRPVGFAL